MSSDLVSVIIPTYNRAIQVIDAIQSVIKQTYPHWELLIIDDGSLDGTESRVQKFLSDRISYFKTENRGVSAARNFGLDKSRGEWVAFLDSDDRWLPKKLELQINFLQKNPTIRIVHGEEIWIRNGRRVNQGKRHAKSGGDLFVRSLELCLISPSAVLLNKKLMEEMEGFDETYPVCEDYDLWLKITSLYPVGFIEQPIIQKYGGHEDQLSRKFPAMDYWRIRSMASILKTRTLSSEKRMRVIDEIRVKAEILLNGYRKRNSLKKIEEVESILREIE